jgi:nucleotide-binding universal stress UspA family protein
MGAATSILMVRPSATSVAQYEGSLQPARYRRILVPLDGSQRAEHVLPMASALAEHHDAEVVLLHIVARPPLIQRMPLSAEELEMVNQVVSRNQNQAIAYFDQLSSRLPIRHETRVLVEEDTAGSIHRFVQENMVDLVLLSAHGYTGRQQWPFGSLATSFLVYGSTTVLILQDMARNGAPAVQSESTAHTRQDDQVRAPMNVSTAEGNGIAYDRAAN